MATKSITKNVNIKNKKSCRSFIAALEQARKKPSKKVILSKPFREIKGEEIAALFGDGR